MGKRILIDIDGTLYDSEDLWVRLMFDQLGISVSAADMAEWDWFHRLDVSRERFNQLVVEHYHSADTIGSNEPYPGAAAIIADWRASGHEVHIVSDRGEASIEATRAWLAVNRITYDALDLRSPSDKLAYIRAHDIDVVIDDRPSLLLEVLEQGGGVVASTLIQSPNANLVATEPRIIAASDWPTLARALEPHLGPAPSAARAAAGCLVRFQSANIFAPSAPDRTKWFTRHLSGIVVRAPRQPVVGAPRLMDRRLNIQYWPTSIR
jgi:uncharacterized HAD superfamily protein